MPDVDVLFVGGGPAGAACARRRVQAPLHALLVERSRLPRTKPCSGLVALDAERFVTRNFGAIPHGKDETLSISSTGSRTT